MFAGECIRFSEVLTTLSRYPSLKNGCLVDTSILFAASYPPDKFNRESEELFEFLAELEISLYANINIRSEFMNKQRQVMIPEGLSDLYTSSDKSIDDLLYRRLQSAYASISEFRSNGRSYKFDENKIKIWRDFLRARKFNNTDAWLRFCSDYLQGKIENVWDQACLEFGVKFLSMRGPDQPPWLHGKVTWEEMAVIIGKFGVASSDAMIINLFLNSHFVALITADEEISYVVNQMKPSGKLVIVPDRLEL